MASRTGVEMREKSIRVGFSWNGKWVRETLKIAPTPANQKYAERLVANVKRSIDNGTFVYHDFFPEGKLIPRSGGNATFGEMCDSWLKTKGQLALKTRKQYANAIGVWKRMFGENTPISELKHIKVAEKIGDTPWASARLLNNYLICLRGVFNLAGRDMKLDNPMDGIENSKFQKSQPDPLSVDEMNAILKWMEFNVDEVVWAYYEFAFMTGMRPEEIIALKWKDFDEKASIISVVRAKSDGELKDLKTYNARDVELISRAKAAVMYMKQITGGKPENFIFMNPVTQRPWHDERSQRDHYWKPALVATKTRYRRSYQTRHTYAANSLLAGVNPTYVARQMGHANAKMLFTVYAKWIDGADRGREKAKMEQMLGGLR